MSRSRSRRGGGFGRALRALDSFGLAAQAFDARARAAYWTDSQIRRRNREYKRAGAPDGFPLPPPSLVYTVVGHHDLRSFYEGGVARFGYISDLLAEAGTAANECMAVLDFGCGCGRVLRHWHGMPADLVGSDYNPRLIQWCRHNLPFARFFVNGFQPPLPFDNEQFDLVYAISVFTHLDEGSRFAWLRELIRTLRPGGYMLITTNGKSAAERHLKDADLERWRAGSPVTTQSMYAGTNLCAAFLPKRYVHGTLAADMEVVVEKLAPAHLGDGGQDGFLLRKP